MDWGLTWNTTKEGPSISTNSGLYVPHNREIMIGSSICLSSVKKVLPLTTSNFWWRQAYRKSRIYL